MAGNDSGSAEAYLCSSVNSLLLPVVSEATWHPGARAVLYLLGLLWSFMGVSIVADVFMTAIERITSSTRRVQVYSSERGGNEEVEVKIWNDTVANLTLMALGSSAPEILLSVIEIVGNGFQAGDLGPSTIVGSAAFNLLAISAACVLSVGPDGRRVRQFGVFCLTAAFSVFAYAWLVVILVVVSPGQVDVWEGVVTFLLFFVLVLMAYAIDQRLLCGGAKAKQPAASVDEAEVRDFVRALARDGSLTEEELQQVALRKFSEKLPHSRAWYRISATRHMMGGQKLTPQLPQKLLNKLQQQQQQQEQQQQQQQDGKAAAAVVEFCCPAVAVLEREQRARVGVCRHSSSSSSSSRVVVLVETLDGTATSGVDYVAVRQQLVFQPGDVIQYVDVEIIDDNEWEPDETFFLKLSVDPECPDVRIGKQSVAQVTIINDDEPGTFELENPSQLVQESCGTAVVPVRRVNGADGSASVSWRTEDQTAKSGVDFAGGSGQVTFDHGEIEKSIRVGIIDRKDEKKDLHFKLLLTECSEGAKIGKSSATILTIVSDDEYRGLVHRLAAAAHIDLAAIKVGSDSYAQQLRQAMNVNGGDLESATTADYVLHFFTFLWKIVFALIPPASIWGGWLCFFVSLGMIGLVTAVVGDLASIFGCLVGLKDSVTAITFVALGTSLPDLFASRQAAVADDCADNAIGNVTGSNSVNVFLGLGLPWMIAACYHAVAAASNPALDGRFKVEAGSLVFSVLLYSGCSVVALGLLVLRRVACGAELGGAVPAKVATAAILLALWLLYITFSSLKAYGVF